MFHLGYAELEAMLTTHPQEQPIFMTLIDETTNNDGIEKTRHYLHVSDIRDGMGRYCRIPLGVTLRLDPDEKKREMATRINGAADIVREHIQEGFGFAIEPALVSLPKDLKITDGSADFMRFDPEKKVFVLAFHFDPRPA